MEKAAAEDIRDAAVTTLVKKGSTTAVVTIIFYPLSNLKFSMKLYISFFYE
jgi:hypothetical protein